MAGILPFTTTPRRRRMRRPRPRDEARGEIVIFSGVRIERIAEPLGASATTPKNAPVKAG